LIGVIISWQAAHSFGEFCWQMAESGLLAIKHCNRRVVPDLPFASLTSTDVEARESL
jgi:hypothetical protein